MDVEEMKRRLVIELNPDRLRLLHDDGARFGRKGVKETNRSGMGAFESGVRPFDIVAVVAVDEGIVAVFPHQFDEGIEFSFWELLFVFNDKEILIPE